VYTRDAQGYVRVYRCPCELGAKHSGEIFSPSDKEHKKPLSIAVWGEKKSGRDKAAGKDE
jgi:hypothetical protein